MKEYEIIHKILYFILFNLSDMEVATFYIEHYKINYLFLTIVNIESNLNCNCII